MGLEPKRRKIDQPLFQRNVSLPIVNKVRDATSMRSSMVLVAPTSGTNVRIQQAKNLAIAQAQQDDCTGNFKIFDSQFSNFLVPVIPSHAELAE